MPDPLDAEILEWLSPIRFDQRQKQADNLAQKTKGTVEWFLESSKFTAWLVKNNQTLFCPGGPGEGKTVVTATVIDTLIRRFHDDLSAGIAYIYCDFNMKDGQQPEQLFASLLRQLGQQLPVLPATLKTLHRKFVRGGLEMRPSPNEILGALEAVIPLFTRVFILIDGLDELQVSSRDRFLDQLIQCQAKCRFNLFATSRKEPAIVRHFEHVTELPIGASDGDIRILLDEYPGRRLRHNFEENPGLEDQVKDSVVQQANGSFLWALLMLDELNRQVTVGSIKRTLDGSIIPPGIESAYQRIMEQINGQDEVSSNIAKSTLGWLAYSKGTLTNLELRHALAAEAGALNMDQENLVAIEDLISVCAGLVITDATKDTIQLVDVTAHHYIKGLQNLHGSASDADTRLAKACLRYVSMDAFGSGFASTDVEFESRKRRCVFFDYAARHWGHHLHAALTNLDNEAMEFLSNKNLVAAACQAMTAEPQVTGPGYSQRATRGMTGLHLAAHFDLKSIIQLLITRDHDCTPLDSKGQTPLWLATEKGHVELMQMLSKVDRRTFRIMNQRKEKDLAQKLIRVAGHCIRDFRKRTPVHTSVLEDDLTMLKAAVLSGASLDDRDSDGRTPLILAIRARKTPMIDFLLNSSADTVGIKADDWRQAYERPDAAMVQLLEDSSGGMSLRFSLESPSWTIDSDSKLRRLTMSKTGIPRSNEAIIIDQLRCIKHKFIFDIKTYEHDQVYRYFIAVSVPSLSVGEGAKPAWSTEEIRVAWTIMALKDANGKEDWTSTGHFSTLTHGSMPETGAAFFDQLIQNLNQQWLLLCSEAEHYLNASHAVVLQKRGLEHTLIRRLLRDARKWNDLRSILRQHIETAHGFRMLYAIKDYDDKNIEGLADTIDSFEKEVGTKLTELDKLSQNQIQIEFNLTSIAEAQKSTSTNRSMKRLTWITFIFLPLTFITGIMGMNVDVLKSNPPWWWYIVLAFIVLMLTLSVWIIFKRTNLEETLEEKFAWLVGRAKVVDDEIENDKAVELNDKKIV